MVSRNTFTYSAFTLGAVGAAALLLHSVMVELVGDAQAAKIITAIVVSFCLGAFAAMLAIYAGAQLRGQPTARPQELPPRRVYVNNAPASQTGSVTTPSLTLQNNFVADTKPIVLVENGLPHFLETREQKKYRTVVEWAEADPRSGRMVYRSVDVQTLRRFARLHTPSRAEWSGRATTYSECLAYFKFVAWLQPSINNGVEWMMHYKKLHRRLAYLGDLAETSPETSPSLTPYLLPS